MRLVSSIVLYTGLAVGANPLLAGPADLGLPLRGAMAKMVRVAADAPLPAAQALLAAVIGGAP